jgi:hypothetical protein
MHPFCRASRWAGLTLLTIVMSAPAYGQGVVLRDGFELDSVGAAPTGWSAPRGGVRAFVAEGNPAEGQRALVLELDDSGGADAFGAISLRLGATPYRGREVRFEAFVRSVLPDAGSWSALFLRVDRLANEILYLDTMQDRPIRAKEWQRYRIVADIALALTAYPGSNPGWTRPHDPRQCDTGGRRLSHNSQSPTSDVGRA